MTERQPVAQYDCGAHKITYWSTRPGCPLCEADRDIKRLRESTKQLAEENMYLREQLHAAHMQTDSVVGYRTASGLLDDDDRSFVKTVLYRVRDESSVSLRPMFAEREVRGRRQTEIKRIAVGFIVTPRDGDSYPHECTSIGGLAIADMFDEAVNSIGLSQATKNMVRGLADLLPGSATR